MGLLKMTPNPAMNQWAQQKAVEVLSCPVSPSSRDETNSF